MSLDWKNRLGALWAEEADRLDALLGPLGEAGLRAAPPPAIGRILDLGCGAGAFTHAIACAAPDAEVLGVDISPDLLATARRRFGEARVRWTLADAGAHDFGAPLDAIYSRCGAQFFREPARAYAHLRASCRPGARFVAVVWGPAEENPWCALPLQVAAAHIGAAAALPKAGDPGPFAWADPSVALGILSAAGWKEARAIRLEAACALNAPGAADPIAAALEVSFAAGPLASRLRSESEALRAAVRADLAVAFAPFVEDGAVRMQSAGWAITGLA